MSEEKDKHTDVEKLFDAKTNTFFNTRLGIVDADLTKNPFRPANQTRSNVIIPRSQTHEVVDGHFDGEIISFETSPPSPALSPAEGDLYWNTTDKTLNIKTDTDTVIQVGQETVLRIVNRTGGELSNGTVVYVSGADVPADRPTAVKADASTWEDSQTTIGVMTSDVADDAEGFVTIFGLVRDVDTSGMIAGDAIYLSETVGVFTTTRPTSPAFIIDLGVVIKVGASDGVIFISVNNRDDYGFFNGSFVESFDLTVAEDTGAIIASLQREGGGNLTMRFGSNFSTLTTPPMTKTLVAGTATVPKANYLYILESDQTQITLSNSSYPTNVDHIKIAKVVVFTAAITATDDALANQNVNDHAVDNIGMGHLAHIGEWIRSQPASWVSGVAGNSATGDDYLDITAGPDAAFFVSVAGTIRQLHLQSYAARDNTDWIYVINDPDAAYTRVTELIAGIDKLSTGVAIGNNKYFALVFWGIQNKSGETSQMICNLPSGQYNSQLGAENDINGFTNVDIPGEFRSTGFLICKLVIQLSGATWVYKSTLDLRGTNPSIVTGAGGGSAIVSFPDNTFEIFDSDDPTKLIDFQVSGVAAGNKREITALDETMNFLTVAEKAALHAKYLDSEAIAAADLLDLSGISSYIQRVNVGDTWGGGGPSSNENMSNSGYNNSGTGAIQAWFNVSPPEWLVKYAEAQGKTITLTTVDFIWQNFVNADHMTRCILYFMDISTITNGTNIFDNNPATLGQGSTGGRTDTFNNTDQAIAKGDWFIFRAFFQQGTANSCRVHGFNMTYTIA